MAGDNLVFMTTRKRLQEVLQRDGRIRYDVFESFITSPSHPARMTVEEFRKLVEMMSDAKELRVQWVKEYCWLLSPTEIDNAPYNPYSLIRDFDNSYLIINNDSKIVLARCGTERIAQKLLEALA